MSKIIYGFHSINGYIETNCSNIEMIYIDTKRHDQRVQSLLELAKSLNIAVTNIAANELDRLTKTKNNQGVAALVKLNNKFSLKEVLVKLATKAAPQILILDGVTDPQNLGSIIRTADCFGVDAIILPKNNSANIDNAVVAKVSSGAINNLAIVTVNNLAQAMDELKDHGFWIVGTGLAKEAINLFEFKFDGNLAWVMGNEGSGMRRLVQEHCDYIVTIPLLGNTQSLNVAVATGVVLAYANFMQIKVHS